MLDTNICIYILKNNPPSVAERFRRFNANEIMVSSVVVAEARFGAYKSQNTKRNLAIWDMFFKPFEIVAFDDICADYYAKIRADLERSGQIIGNMDMLIASCAMANKATLITNNEREFSRIAGLRTQNWI